MNFSKSQSLYERAVNIIPGGVNSPVRACKSVGADPLFIERGEGCMIYDADGNITSKTDALGTTTYSYDAANRLLTVNEPLGRVTAHTYDLVGNRLTITNANDTPVLENSGDMALTSIFENQVNSTGTLVSDLVASAGRTQQDGALFSDVTGADTDDRDVERTSDLGGQ